MLPKLFAPQAYEEKKELVESVRAMMMRQSEEGIIGALYASVAPGLNADLAEIEVPDTDYYGGTGRDHTGRRSAEYAGAH